MQIFFSNYCWVVLYFSLTKPRGLGPKREHAHTRKRQDAQVEIRPVQMGRGGVPRAAKWELPPLASELSGHSRAILYLKYQIEYKTVDNGVPIQFRSWGQPI